MDLTKNEISNGSDTNSCMKAIPQVPCDNAEILRTDKNNECNSIDNLNSEKCFCTCVHLTFGFALRVIIILCFLGKVGVECKTAYQHYRDGNYVYFGFTIGFLILGQGLASVLSFMKYREDKSDTTFCDKSIRVVFLVLLLSPVLRDVDEFRYWILKKTRPRDKIKYHALKLHEDEVSSFLKLVIAFTKNGPQILLQLVIMALSEDEPLPSYKTILWQTGVVCVSLIAMSVSIVLNRRAGSLKDGEPFTFLRGLVLFLCNFLLLLSRAISISLFASLYLYYLIAILVIRWWVMTALSIREKVDGGYYKFFSCSEERWLIHTCDCVVKGLIFLLCFVSPVQGSTRRCQIFYYFYTFVESSLLIVIWYIYCPAGLWYSLPAILTHFVAFPVGIIMLLFYYVSIHPKTMMIF